MAQGNDSQSSINVTGMREMSVSQDLERDSPISRLPPELVISIFSKLSSTSDLLNCMLVSRNWATNCVGILWHRPLCNNWKNLHNVVASVSKPSGGYFPYYDLVKRLNLASLHEKINDGTVQTLTHCKRVERLTLTNCARLTDMGVSSLLEGNKHLQALDVSDLDSLTDHTLHTVANNCPRLQGLNISGCVKVTDDSLVQISQRCRQIKRVWSSTLIPLTTLTCCIVETQRLLPNF
jgi:F-box and leucine-rich repeat protein GRR1